MPNRAFDLETTSGVKLKNIGVKIVTDVDKSGFIKIASPYLEKMAKDLGPHARQDPAVDQRHTIASVSATPRARRGRKARQSARWCCSASAG